ncbi:MAG TPA: hypothetical protein VJ508_09620, partial [Saprospiraceae bacterium]|nr:hypothetical protein [Saprospiraceae bacterium]
LRSLGLILVLALVGMIPMGYIAVAAAKDINDLDHSYKTESDLLTDPILTDAGYVSGTLVDTQLITSIYLFK